jgi:hypothetical protein
MSSTFTLFTLKKYPHQGAMAPVRLGVDISASTDKFKLHVAFISIKGGSHRPYAPIVYFTWPAERVNTVQHVLSLKYAV